MATDSIILLLVLSISCLCSSRDIYIQPSEGEHCPGTCYNITTFGKMAGNFSNSSGLVVHFMERTHLLDLKKPMVFMSLTNAVFEGDGRMEQGFHETVWQSTVVIKCTEHSSTGIAFVNSSNITFRYITITNCGADMFTLTQQNYTSSSLGFINVGNITIDHVSVQNGSGNGLLVTTSEVGRTIITNSAFAQNVQHRKVIGSSVFILHIDPLNCVPWKYVHKTLITNTNVSFGNNKGLSIGMLQRSYSVAIVLDYVTAYGNRGLYGNIHISAIEHKVPTYNLTINNTVSSHGTIALKISSSNNIGQYKNCSTNPNSTINNNLTIIIANSKFTNNNRTNGSVMTIGFVGVKFSTAIIIESTEICHNIGSGLQLYHLSYEQQSQLLVTLLNVIAGNNSIPSFPNNGSRTISAYFVTRLVLNNVSITNNNMTGLSVYRTAVVVNGTSVFHNNTGIDGGGLAMYGSSYLMFEKDSILYFTNNSAQQRGGAIFVERQQNMSPCFFQYSDMEVLKSAKVAFFGNTAEKAGSVLFGGNIENCVLFNYYFYLIPSDKCFTQIFNYSAQTGPSVISSEPTDVCFCDDKNTINCSQTQLTMTAYPGEEINISVVTVGQLNGVAPGILQIQPVGSNILELHNTNAKNCMTIQFKPVKKPYSVGVLGKPCSKRLDLNFSGCPLGFEMSNKTNSCDCEELQQMVTTISCNAATNEVMRAHQGNIWIGNISDVLTYSSCPFDYCNTAQVNFSLTDPDPQCALNRTGILCGKCRDGLSLALGSNNCIPCSELSYLALIIPFAAAGFGLVALLMVLNLTVSIGTINGLIFYASIVKMGEQREIFFPNGSIPVLSQFIAWLNLDLGFETCFYPGMTAYAKMWLQFVFPLYIWFIIATIIVLCPYSTWLSNKIGGNVVQVLATLILLSFTKIFHAIALIIKSVKLSCVNGYEDLFVWYMDGHIPYFSLEHNILMAAAVLFLLLAVPYTLSLLFDAVIEKYLTRIRFFRRQWIKFKPFVDAYHGPYKDNCRFWTGLLLLVRMSFTFFSLYLGKYMNASLIFITTSTGVLLSLMIYFDGVYQKKYLNILEWSFLINLILLSAIYSSLHEKAEPQQLQVVTIISVSVALVTCIGVIIYHIFLRVKNIKCIKNFTAKKLGRNIDAMSERLLENDEDNEDDEDSDYVCRRLVRPKSTDMCLRRETLIC